MAKQLFNSSESSNFILNMTEEKFSRLASWGLLAACFTTSLFTIVPELADSGLYSIVAGGLAVAGVICMILALIAFMKGYVEKRVLLPVCAFGVMVLWGVISLINSYDTIISLYGYSGRGEGLLAILFYAAFFITGISIKREKPLITFIYGIIGVGALNAVWGLVQVIAGVGSYKFASVEIQVNAASGLAQSPLFLAMLLSLSLTAALMTAVLTSDSKRRIICIVCACLFSFVMMFTYSLIGICGIAIALTAAAVTVFAHKADKKLLLTLLSGIAPAALAAVIVSAGAIGNISGYRLYDGRLLWWADSYYRLSASGEPDTGIVDIDSTYDVYYTLNSRTMRLISRAPLTGTGPEQLVFPQLYTASTLGGTEAEDITDIVMNNKGTFDKVYNEYLYTAATRGIPSTIALIAVLLPVLYLGYRNMKRRNSWTGAVLFGVTVCGVLLFFIGCSNITFSPIFWAAAGASCVELDRKKQ
ncbi:MAG: hypothetical protein IJ874_09070 [Ruminococcus sp.]|nr:hypothetical protein [Ruminococcus sp.]